MQDEVRTSRKAGAVAVAVAVVAFGLFVALLPRLQPDRVVSSGTEDGTVDARPVGNTTVETPSPAVTAAPTTTTVPATTTTVAPEPEVSPYVIPAPPGVDAALGFTVSIDNGREGKEAALIADGDPLTWTFRVSNEGSEYLWGIFVFLELHGPATCETTRLAAGQSTGGEQTPQAEQEDASANTGDKP